MSQVPWTEHEYKEPSIFINFLGAGRRMTRKAVSWFAVYFHLFVLVLQDLEEYFWRGPCLPTTHAWHFALTAVM